MAPSRRWRLDDGLRPPTRLPRAITTRERDLTVGTILAFRGPEVGRRLSGSTHQHGQPGGASWNPSVRRSTARGRARTLAGTSSSSAPSSRPAARSPRCSPPARPAAGPGWLRRSRNGRRRRTIRHPRLLGTAALSGPITLLAGGGDPSAEPALKKVYDDFKAQNPGIEWDIRALPGFGPDWDRLARAALESGEPVGLVMIDGLFVRAWTRDGLLADLGPTRGWPTVLARVPANVPPRPGSPRPPRGPFRWR